MKDGGSVARSRNICEMNVMMTPMFRCVPEEYKRSAVESRTSRVIRVRCQAQLTAVASKSKTFTVLFLVKLFCSS
jgi:hypothetical protein